MRVPPRAGVLATTRTALSFVGASVVTATSTAQAITFPVGTQTGDLAIVMCWAGIADTASISGGAGGWTKNTITWTNFGYFSSIFYKTLAAGDVGGVTVNQGNNNAMVILVYRNAAAVSVKATNPGSATTSLSLAGFTKNASCKGVVSIVQDRDPTASFAPPGTFASRALGVGVNFASGGADIVNPSNYVDGTNVVWTGFVNTFDQVGWLLELT